MMQLRKGILYNGTLFLHVPVPVFILFRYNGAHKNVERQNIEYFDCILWAVDMN
jgi:hypothetical protein